MYEKVSKYHPDKVADRIAGALVDLAYSLQEDPKIAVEVLIGHGVCHIISETSVQLPLEKVAEIVNRIAGDVKVDYTEVPQDVKLASNQAKSIKCGDNGIFKGMPVTDEQEKLAAITQMLDVEYPSDGKYIINEQTDELIICQSNAHKVDLKKLLEPYGYKLIINPLGEWTGGIDVDTGATNRKLGSDMADSVTGGGLVGKDLSKADVSINIYCWLLAQELNEPVEAYCAIGDGIVDIDGVHLKYTAIVERAKDYIKQIGGFEKFAEYGLIR